MTTFLELVLIPALVPLAINVLIIQIEHWTNSADTALDVTAYANAASAGPRNIQQEQGVRT